LPVSPDHGEGQRWSTNLLLQPGLPWAGLNTRGVVVRRARSSATNAIGTLAGFWFFDRLLRFSTRAAMRFTGGTKMTSALKFGLFAVVAAIATLAASPATADLKP